MKRKFIPLCYVIVAIAAGLGMGILLVINVGLFPLFIHAMANPETAASAKRVLGGVSWSMACFGGIVFFALPFLLWNGKRFNDRAIRSQSGQE